MRRDDVRFAAAARDDGIRKVSKYTWRAGAAGVAFSALIAVAFGHHVATPSGSGSSGRTQQSTAGNGQPSAGSGGSSGTQGGSTIVVPAQPPAPAQGGGQVTSGAS
jgi:hypothetical protein